MVTDFQRHIYTRFMQHPVISAYSSQMFSVSSNHYHNTNTTIIFISDFFLTHVLDSSCTIFSLLVDLLEEVFHWQCRSVAGAPARPLSHSHITNTRAQTPECPSLLYTTQYVLGFLRVTSTPLCPAFCMCAHSISTGLASSADLGSTARNDQGNRDK